MACNAALPGRQKLFLTMIGGGVFINKKKWIIDAMAQCESLIVASGLAVTLVIYDRADLNDAHMAALRELAVRTGGTVELLDARN